MAKKIGIVLALDGEKQFTQGLSNAKQESARLQAELKKLSAEYEGSANSLEYLQKKQENLAAQTTSYTQKLEASKKGLENAQSVQKKAAERYEELTKALEKAKTAQKAMADAGETNTKESKQQAKEVEDLEKAVEKQGLEVQKCEGKVSSWSKKVADAETDIEKNSRAVQQNEKYLKEAENATDKCAKSIDEFGKTAKDAADSTSNFGEAVVAGLTAAVANKGLETLSDTVGKVADAIKETATDVSKANAQLASTTGTATGAANKYKDVMDQIKAAGYGESYSDVASVMGTIVQNIGELNDVELTNITESAITLRDAFGMDVQEQMRAVNVMVQTMGVSATEAFDLIAAGAQRGLNRSDELVDNLAEYGSLWGQAGFSASEAFAIMENGLNSGAYNLDKVNDFVKEFGISLSDGRIEENLSSFSTGTQELFQQWKNGEATTADVFYSIISDLESMENQQDALTIASNTWSALGEDNAMQVITALNDVNTSYEQVQGTMDTLKETSFSDVESAIERLGDALQSKFITPIAEVAGGVVADFANAAADALTGASDDVDEYYESVMSATEEIKSSIEATGETFNSSLESVDRVSVLGERLQELNSVQDRTNVQKQEMAAIVEELSQSIPELSGAYDTENDKLNVTNTELEDLVKNYEQVAVKQTLLSATQELVNQKTEAAIQLDQAKQGLENIEAKIKLLEQENEIITRVQNEQLNGDFNTDYETEVIKIYQQALENGIITLDEFTEAQERAAKGPTDDRLYATGKEIGELDKQTQSYTDAIEENQDSIDEADKKLTEYTESVERVYGVKTDATDATKEQTDAESELTEQTTKSTEATEDEAAATEAATAAKDAQTAAIQSVKEEYESLVDSIKSSLQDKISLFDIFDTSDGGEDVSVEEMTKNLDSQIEAFTKYQENLEAVKEHVGKEIAPEFMEYLEEMGMDGANTLEHILQTLEDDEPEKVKELSDKWMAAMDQTESIAKVSAANQTALKAALGELGSTDADFTSLRESIETAVSDAAEGWSGLDDATRESMEEVIATAQEMGAEIPEGLAEGIEEGTTSPAEAIAQLNASMQGRCEGLLQVAQEAGIQIPANIKSGIEAGGSAAVEAYNALIALLAQKANEAESAGQEAGAAQSAGYTAGIQEGQDDATTAAGTVAQAGADAATNKKSEFETAGQQAANEYATGMASSSSARAAGGSMASQAQAGAAAHQSSFRTTGYNVATGFAAGIEKGTVAAVNAAVNMVKQTKDAANRAAKTASPSKLFRDEVGKWIALGFAEGITKNTKAAKTAASKMVKVTASTASSWLSDYRKNHETTIEEEKYFWQQVKNQAKKGTSAYKKAVSEISKLSSSGTITSALSKKISSNFGVSATETDSKGNTTKKAVSEYYNEILDAAEKALSKYQTLHATSTAQEINYWKSVRKRLKSGTDAWYEATQKIQELTADQTEAAEKAAEEAEKEQEEKLKTQATVLSKMLSTYKTYNSMSLKAEMQYWDAARKLFAEGTEQRVEADKNYFEAKEEYEQELLDLQEDYADKKLETEEDYADKIKDLEDTLTDTIKSRKKEILSAMGDFDAWDAEGYVADTMLYNLQTQVEGLNLWVQQLEELGQKGLPDELMDELREMGPDAAANIYTLNNMTAEQLDQFVKLWQEKTKLAGEQAEKENKTLIEQTQQEIEKLAKEREEALKKLETDNQTAIANISTNLETALKNLVKKSGSYGEEMVASLINGIQTKASEAASTSSGGNSGTGGTSGSTSSTTGEDKAVAAAQAENKSRAAIEAAIASGTDRSNKVTSAEAKKHSDLWTYIVKKYGKSLNNAKVKDLGDALGVSTSKTPTDKQKASILAALKKKGYASGTRKILEDQLAWISEGGTQEYIVRASDGAIMQNMLQGDKVINPAASENLYDFANNPDAFLAARVGIAKLNGITAGNAQPVVNVDNSEVTQAINTLSGRMDAIASRMENLQVLMDGDTVVGKLAPKMSKSFAATATRTTRGNAR